LAFRKSGKSPWLSPVCSLLSACRPGTRAARKRIPRSNVRPTRGGGSEMARPKRRRRERERAKSAGLPFTDEDVPADPDDVNAADLATALPAIAWERRRRGRQLTRLSADADLGPREFAELVAADGG